MLSEGKQNNIDLNSIMLLYFCGFELREGVLATVCSAAFASASVVNMDAGSLNWFKGFMVVVLGAAA